MKCCYWLLASLLALLAAGCRSDAVPRPLYALSVTNGSGSGSYEAGSVVQVSAQAPRPGLEFLAWHGDAALLNDSLAPQTELLMPERDMLLIARFADTTAYLLAVSGGSGSGRYVGGTEVVLVAGPAPHKQQFACWAGDTAYLTDPCRDTTLLIMPYQNTLLEATYEDLPFYPLEVVNGSGSGDYQPGDTVAIVADAPPAGQQFAAWESDTATLHQATKASTWLVMPAAAARVEATYAPIPTFALVVEQGEGSGDYLPGTTVAILPFPAPPGERFIRWGGDVRALVDFLEAQTQARVDAPTYVVARYRSDTLPILSYRLDIRPTTRQYCDLCHVPGTNYSDLTTYQGVFDNLAEVERQVKDGRMPQGIPFSAEARAVLLAWIEQGALDN
ncbi:MAG: hypothetical protein OHK0039_45170 [Bacteroidia bacterium]